jgi:hemerythrin-like metal-binding protein
MPLIEWDESYRIDIGEIDNQHKKLMQIMNDLHAAMRQGKGKQVIGDIISSLVDYTNYHFSLEQSIFEQYKYPAALSHLAEHQEFIDRVNDFTKKFSENQLGLTLEVMNFLSNWLTRHIKGSDMQYAKYLHSIGAK